MSHIPTAAMPHAVKIDQPAVDESILARIPSGLRSTPALVAAGAALAVGLAAAALPLLRRPAKPAPKRKRKIAAA